MSKPSKPSETHGEALPPTWSSERWCARNPSCSGANYQTTSTELFKRAGKQFKRKHPGKHEERLVCRLETVTTVPHEDPVRGRDRVRGICAACKYLAFSWPACVPASAGVTLVTAPTSRIAHHAPRARRRVLGCGYGPRQRVAPVCRKRLKAETRPRGPVYRRSRDAATGLLCASHLLGMLSNNQPRELAL
jgi:hypothetical protein